MCECVCGWVSVCVYGWMTSDLEDVLPRSYVSDVDPLAVDVMAIGIPATNGDALISHVVAGVTLLKTCRRGNAQPCCFSLWWC